MNWAGISIVLGLVVVAVATGPLGAVLFGAAAWWLWRKG